VNLLEVQGLVKRFGGRKVVDDVSFNVAPRQIVGLLGRNGAGKTTTFRMILGMLRPDLGTVAFDGQDVTDEPMFKRARRGIGYLSQERSDFRRLTVEQNLLAILETRGLSRSERMQRADDMLSRYGLTHVRKSPAGVLSGGERRKLELSRALVTDPKLMLLDEPFAGVDPVAKEEIQDEIRRLRSEFGKSVLITDHDAERTLQVCDLALIVDGGKLLFAGSPAEAAADETVRRVYLGHNFARGLDVLRD
jgi:lipopolysaccharide export system ATP-binding protein